MREIKKKERECANVKRAEDKISREGRRKTGAL